jgi:GDP-mannose 6-dehydrogenase
MACLAESGHEVIGVDVSTSKVDLVNSGSATIVEDRVSEIISQQKSHGRISATTDGIAAVKSTEVSFICVGTPSGPNGHTDTSAIKQVLDEIGRGIREKGSFHTVVIRSTVPPGTNVEAAGIIEAVSGKRKNLDFGVVSNPEFLREGTAVKDYYEPPYTLVASESPLSIEMMREVYKTVNAPFMTSEIGVAEMIKYVNNTFHALKITFANEVGNICKKLNIDSHELMEVFCVDKKLNISPYYLKPGFAYGGSCLPKDLRALKTLARDSYVDCPIIENIERSNELQKNTVLQQIVAFDKREVGFLGLSFKAGTDDLRNSPIVDIIEQLVGKGFNIRIYDRNVHVSQLIGANREYILRKIPYISQFITDNPQEIIQNSQIIVIVNKDEEFKEILANVNGRRAIVYDLVNLDPAEGKKGPEYFGISW